jgi:hypothetical protein
MGGGACGQGVLGVGRRIVRLQPQSGLVVFDCRLSLLRFAKHFGKTRMKILAIWDRQIGDAATQDKL